MHAGLVAAGKRYGPRRLNHGAYRLFQRFSEFIHPFYKATTVVRVKSNVRAVGVRAGTPVTISASSLSPSYSNFKIVNSMRAIKPPRNERCCWDGKGHHISVVFSNSSRDWTELIRMKWRFKWSSYRPVVSSRWQETPMMSPLPHFTAETKRQVYLGWVPFHTARASQKLFCT